MQTKINLKLPNEKWDKQRGGQFLSWTAMVPAAWCPHLCLSPCLECGLDLMTHFWQTEYKQRHWQLTWRLGYRDSGFSLLNCVSSLFTLMKPSATSWAALPKAHETQTGERLPEANKKRWSQTNSLQGTPSCPQPPEWDWKWILSQSGFQLDSLAITSQDS